jgi:BMFP domain-containing protein YqiC
MEPDPKIWGAYDLVGTLFNRDKVEAMLARLPEALADKVRGVVDEFDEEYRAITVDDDRGEIVEIGDVSRDRDGWWWHRIPDRGPVREELDRLTVDSTVLGSAVRSRFTDDELALLDRIAQGDPAHEKSRLLVSMASWGSGVRIVAWQLSSARPLPHLRIWGVQDLIGVLLTRDRVEALVSEVPESLAGKVRGVLGEFDEQYRAITVEVDGDELVRAGRVSRDREGWWWYRIPGVGPVRVELDLLAADAGSEPG